MGSKSGGTVKVEEPLLGSKTVRMANYRIQTAGKILTEATRYEPEVAVERTPVRASSQGVGIQLTAVLTIAIGLLSVACAVVASDGVTLVNGNVLAERVLADTGPGGLDAYRMTSMAFGLVLSALGIRTATVTARSALRGPRLTPAAQAVLSGVVAANLALIAWWTGWLFV
jgi:hypothetical protein